MTRDLVPSRIFNDVCFKHIQITLASTWLSGISNDLMFFSSTDVTNGRTGAYWCSLIKEQNKIVVHERDLLVWILDPLLRKAQRFSQRRKNCSYRLTVTANISAGWSITGHLSSFQKHHYLCQPHSTSHSWPLALTWLQLLSNTNWAAFFSQF